MMHFAIWANTFANSAIFIRSKIDVYRSEAKHNINDDARLNRECAMYNAAISLVPISQTLSDKLFHRNYANVSVYIRNRTTTQQQRPIVCVADTRTRRNTISSQCKILVWSKWWNSIANEHVYTRSTPNRSFTVRLVRSVRSTCLHWLHFVDITLSVILRFCLSSKCDKLNARAF